MFMYIYKCMYVSIYLQASGGRCAETELSSYWLCETKNKRCGSGILTTKLVTQTNNYINHINFENSFVNFIIIILQKIS